MNTKGIKNFKIPLLSIPDKPIISTSQDHLPIADITEDIIVYKDGGAAIVMETTSLNFGLLSEKEQQAVIAAYAALINSLSFQIQIFIRSQRKDISDYLKYLDNAQKSLENTKLSYLMQGYRQFILDTIKKKNVLGKSFYIIIPFSALELGVAKSAASLTKRTGPLPYPKSYVIKKAKIAIYPKRDHLIRQAGRLGLKLKQLSTVQLIDLFFSIYNSEPPTLKKTEQDLLKS
ncbi:MAG TPA: hypothetical protein VJ399_01885 [Patescibacteria group bacterium]|nr:hypothetical protein [Patescibacteria group bacterium]